MSVDGIVVYSGPGGTPFDGIYLRMNSPYWRPAWVTYFDDLSFNGDPATVPEPSSVALLGIGAVGLLAYAWRKRTPTA